MRYCLDWNIIAKYLVLYTCRAHIIMIIKYKYER